MLLTLSLEECEAIVVVADKWHNKGMATRLMNRLIEVAKEKALKKMIATIPAINADNIAFASIFRICDF